MEVQRAEPGLTPGGAAAGVQFRRRVPPAHDHQGAQPRYRLFSIIDTEWPALAEAYAVWLAPSNFDARGRQRERLSDLTRLVRADSDPALKG